MKNIFLFIAFTGLILSTNAQDELKLKTIKTYYGDIVGDYFYKIGELDGAILNADTLSLLFPEMDVVNVSNDTFSPDVRYEQIIDFFLYAADTSLLLEDRNISQRIPLTIDFFPNDTVQLGTMAFPLLEVIDYLKKEEGIDLEQISYWKIITGISYTSKDGTYSEDVFYEGADTVTFRVVRGNVGIQEIEKEESIVSVYPNPAREQLQITNYELRNGTEDYTIYNFVGQKILQGKLQNETSIINVESLANGIYYLRIAEKTVKFVKN
jgi:hypothetical protein